MKINKPLLAWFHQHGRHNLPWQQNPTLYRVWISEIMLQQTQVTTVIPYYKNFIQHFPTIATLAAAPVDDVLQLWSGLGYYARARNLHRAAQSIASQHDGLFPTNLADVVALPGIGRSTAGAILSLALNQPHPILDGNVKRVLTRLHAIEGWPGKKSIETQLWVFAAQHTPKKNAKHYTQAIMDLGATICTRKIPHCKLCPLSQLCIAHQQQIQEQLPTPKTRKKRPIRNTTFLMLCNSNHQILMEKRAPTGIWGGLWCFPETALSPSLSKNITKKEIWPGFRHTFTHFHLDITPILATTKNYDNYVAEDEYAWYNIETAINLGLAAPTKKLLIQLQSKLTKNGEFYVTQCTLRKTR